MGLRRRFLRLAGVDCGECGIWPGVRFVGGFRVAVGDQSFISSAVLFDATAGIRLGARVAVGPRASFVTSLPATGCDASRADVRPPAAPIVVEDGCWIGASAVILPGVTVGRGCVVAAGAVVTSNCEPDGLYVGSPAVRKRDLPLAVPAAGGSAPPYLS